jgi:hypothetical protein
MQDDFINVGSWFDQNYRDKSRERYVTFKTALNIFRQYDGHIILETGCQRLVDDWGGGCSTLLFAEFCKAYDRHLYTVEIEPKNLDVARQVTESCKNFVTYVLADSHAFLPTFNNPIDLLYLDSLDCPTTPETTAYPAQLHQLTELKLIERKLTEHAVVLLDDNNFPNGGKTRLTKAYLAQTGWLCLLDYQQSLWIRK